MKENQLGTFIILDLDDFKVINDTYGHNVGDEVIVYVGNILKNIQHLLYTNMLPCRFGGDEFLNNFSLLTEEQYAGVMNYFNEITAILKEYGMTPRA